MQNNPGIPWWKSRPNTDHGRSCLASEKWHDRASLGQPGHILYTVTHHFSWNTTSAEALPEVHCSQTLPFSRGNWEISLQFAIWTMEGVGKSVLEQRFPQPSRSTHRTLTYQGTAVPPVSTAGPDVSPCLHAPKPLCSLTITWGYVPVTSSLIGETVLPLKHTLCT